MALALAIAALFASRAFMDSPPMVAEFARQFFSNGNEAAGNVASATDAGAKDGAEKGGAGVLPVAASGSGGAGDSTFELSMAPDGVDGADRADDAANEDGERFAGSNDGYPYAEVEEGAGEPVADETAAEAAAEAADAAAVAAKLAAGEPAAVAAEGMLSLAGGSQMALAQNPASALSAQPILSPVSGLFASLSESFNNDEALQRAFSDASPNKDKIVYLTFDDGPSALTMQFLDVLDQKGVKATFFLVGKNVKKRPEVTKEIYDRGHLLANHSYTHQYEKIYSSAAILFEELRIWDEEVSEALGFGYHADIFRFPGGSSYKTASQYRNAVLARGYRYFDWNCLNGDAQIKDKSAASLLQYMKDTFPPNKDEVIILMHDTEAKQTTLDMLPAAIDYCRERGYRFETLENKTWP